MLRRSAVLFTLVWFTGAWDHLRSLGTPERSGEAEQLILEATNDFRVKNGFRPLVLDQKLADIAHAHSVDMIARNFFDHVNPDGAAPAERIHQQHRQLIGNTGENLSVIVTSPPLSPKLISDQAVDGWMKSSPHRRNLLDPTFTHIGIGVAIDGPEAKVTQNFMQVRGILKDPVPESLSRHEKLVLRVASFPDRSSRATHYILQPIRPVPDQKEVAVWRMSTTRPSVTPGRYTIQFCFPESGSRLEVFPGPQIEIKEGDSP